jgi:CubicO group peptidase (beta-lactamase class C family)
MRDTGFHAPDTGRLATAYERRDGRLEVADAPDGQWSRPPAFADGGAGLVSSVDDVVAFGRMLLRGGGQILAPPTVAEMTRNQLSQAQPQNVWPGFSFSRRPRLGLRRVGTRRWPVFLGRWVWPGVDERAEAQDLTVVVLTQRAADETGMPAVCADVLAAACAA